MRRDAVAEQPFIGAHHAHDNAGGELVGRRTHERGPKAAARKTDAADALGLDVCSHSQDVEGDPVFVVADASWAVDKVDLRGRRWPAEDVHALSLAHLQGEYATVVDTAMTLEAAAMAKARERWRAERAQGGG